LECKKFNSISKFGLSVVTIVFEDDLGTHLPRQLIAEKLNQHQRKSRFLNPEMGPTYQGLEKFTIH
jgi:cobalt-zinc-cadmium resistance protein CzcA